MYVVNSLHSFLQQLLSFIHAARLPALIAAVEAGLSGERRVYLDYGITPQNSHKTAYMGKLL